MQTPTLLPQVIGSNAMNPSAFEFRGEFRSNVKLVASGILPIACLLSLYLGNSPRGSARDLFVFRVVFSWITRPVRQSRNAQFKRFSRSRWLFLAKKSFAFRILRFASTIQVPACLLPVLNSVHRQRKQRRSRDERPRKFHQIRWRQT
jgi:hypothetical protein